MPTMSLELTTTWHESFVRRNVGERSYAGIACSGFQQGVAVLAAQAQQSIAMPPGGLPFVAILLNVDVGASVVVGWVVNDAATELTIQQLSLITPPIGVVPYVKNTAAAGTPTVPVRITILY
jgi:hypothetical protein